MISLIEMNAPSWAVEGLHNQDYWQDWSISCPDKAAPPWCPDDLGAFPTWGDGTPCYPCSPSFIWLPQTSQICSNKLTLYKSRGFRVVFSDPHNGGILLQSGAVSFGPLLAAENIWLSSWQIWPLVTKFDPRVTPVTKICFQIWYDKSCIEVLTQSQHFDFVSAVAIFWNSQLLLSSKFIC